jgi:amino acid transporter
MFLLFAVVIALIGHTTAVAGLILALKNRRRRSHYRDKEAVELMLCGCTIFVLAILIALVTI